jgi:putative hydroxymethylpyrimidine transport system substrate-binding protein
MQAMFRPSLLLALAALLAAGCGNDAGQGGSSTGQAAPRPVSLQLDWYPNPDHVGIYAAVDEHVFARHGLAVSIHQPSDVSDPVKLVAAGRSDLGISYEPELFFAQQEHAPVVAVAALVPTALNSIIARGGEGIDSPADLRGRTIGEDGSKSTAAYLDTVLRDAGLDPANDVKRVDVGFNLVPALLSKKVDAIIGAFQNIEGAQLAARGVDPVVFPVDEHGVPRYDELVLIANRDRLRDDAGYRARVRDFTAALTEATEWARSHPQQAIEVMRRHSSRDYRDVLEQSVPATLKLLDTSALVPDQWEAFGAWMADQGLLDGEPDGRALVTNP